MAWGARISGFVSVAGWFHDSASVAPFYGGPEGVARRLSRAQEALDEYRKTGKLRKVRAHAPGDERAGMSFEMDYYGNQGRGAVPAWSNEMAELSWLHWLGFDGLSAASAVTTPTLLVHSDRCALPDNARIAHARLAGPKQLAWFEAGSQTDYYDQPDYMNAAVERAGSWFQETLR